MGGIWLPVRLLIGAEMESFMVAVSRVRKAEDKAERDERPGVSCGRREPEALLARHAARRVVRVLIVVRGQWAGIGRASDGKGGHTQSGLGWCHVLLSNQCCPKANPPRVGVGTTRLLLDL